MDYDVLRQYFEKSTNLEELVSRINQKEGNTKMATIRDHSKKVKKLATKKKTYINFKSKTHEELEELIKKLKIQRII